MDVGTGLSVLGVFIALTAGILKIRPANGNGNGKHVTTREFDAFRETVGDAMTEIRVSIHNLEQLFRTRL